MPHRPFRHLLLLAAMLIATLSSAVANAGEFPDSWFWGDKMARTRQNQLVGKRAPALTVKNWLTKSADLSELKGKVVLVDFWGTWCGPCMAALPKNNDLMEKYADKGFVVVGVHDGTRGFDQAPGVVKRLNIEYPLGVDSGSTSAKAWRVSFWPTYGVIDRNGKLRALGLMPQYVDKVVAKLIDEPAEKPVPPEAPATDGGTPPAASPPASAPVEAAPPTSAPVSTAAEVTVDPSWREGGEAIRRRLSDLESRAAPPALSVDGWRNSGELKLEDLKGKVVVLWFWGTWCPSCTRSLSWVNAMSSRYKDDGLVVIGVTDHKELNKLDAVIQQYKLEFPICADSTKATATAYKVDGLPDFYVIDRAGKLRIADASQATLDEAIKALLSESAP